MRLLVYLRDGRTVYSIAGRADLARLVRLEPWHEERGVVGGRGIWNPATGEYVWARARIRFISKNSISVVEEGTEPAPPVAE